MEGYKLGLTQGFYLMSRDVVRCLLVGLTPCAKLLYFYLLQEANYEDRIVSGSIIERGQTLRGYAEFQEATAWHKGFKKCMFTKDQVKTSMRDLRKAGLIATRKTTRGMIITLLYYDFYQNPKSYERHTESHNEDHNDATAKATMTPHDKECIKEEKEKKKKGGAADPPFEEGADTPLPREKPPLPFPQPWNDFISLYETQDYPLHAALVNLKSIEDGPNGVAYFTGEPFTVKQICLQLKDIEANASAYFDRHVEIDFKVLSQNSPQKEQAHG